MQKSIVKKKLARKEAVLTVKVAYQDPAIYEMVGLLGFDCIWICNEHIGINPSMMDSIIRACRASGVDSMIRTKPGDYRDLLHPLEMGAKGIMLPRVKDADEVRQVVRDMKFAPQGRRGADGVNAEADFGLVPFVDYMKLANENNFLMVQIEDPETVEHIEEIAAVDGVDIILVGPGDLSIGMGIPGEVYHPKIIEVCERVVKACNKNNIAAGMTCATVERIEFFRKMGFLFLCYGGDYRLLSEGFKNIRKDTEKIGFSFRNPTDYTKSGGFE